jgi:hypothetical protein
MLEGPLDSTAPAISGTRKRKVAGRDGGAGATARAAEVVRLVAVQERENLVVPLGPAVDAEASAELAVVQVGGPPLGVAHSPPAVTVQPPGGDDEQRGQHVAVVVGRDGVRTVGLVDPAHGGLAALAVEAVLEHLAEQQRGVVVPLLGLTAELAGAIEQLPDRGHRIRPVERQLERPGHVPGELVQHVQPMDPPVLRLGVQRLDQAQRVVPAHDQQA